jgi:RNA-directed DNA polymerase
MTPDQGLRITMNLNQEPCTNAHAGAPFLLHLDVANHFPSVNQDRVFSRFIEAGARPDIAWVLARLLCLPDRLPQGAATSNAVAEILMYPLDSRILGLARREGLIYTRYVDDLAVSGGSELIGLEEEFRSLVLEEGWELNGKGGLVGPDEHHRILGLTINQSPGVGREYARALRDDLRKVAAGIISPSEAHLRSLEGRVRWVASMNPGRAATFRMLFDRAVGRAA